MKLPLAFYLTRIPLSGFIKGEIFKPASNNVCKNPFDKLKRESLTWCLNIHPLIFVNKLCLRAFVFLMMHVCKWSHCLHYNSYSNLIQTNHKRYYERVVAVKFMRFQSKSGYFALHQKLAAIRITKKKFNKTRFTKPSAMFLIKSAVHITFYA